MVGIEPGRETLEGLSPAKRELLTAMLLARGRKRAAARTIPRRDPTRPCPLSRGQELLWVSESLAEGRPLYNVPYGVRLRGRLDVTALRAAIDGIVARHAVLRTVYRQHENGTLEQVVRDAQPVPLPVEEVTGETAAFAAAHREAALPMDLSAGPVLRGRLLRISAEDHLLAVVVHHIATDAWSVGVLLSELAELYDAAREQRPARLPQLEIGYADAAAHERATEPGGYDVDEWRQQLAGIEPLALPGGERGQDKTGRRVRARWDASLARALERVAKAHRTTVFSVALTAFSVLLHRYTGTSRFAVGTVLANRTPQTEGLIGYFANTVPIPADVSPGETLADVLARTTARGVWARDHQIPFDALVEGLAPRRSAAESPLFDAMFVFNNGAAHELRLPGLSLAPAELHSSTAKFPLDLSCAVTPDEVLVSLEFDESGFDTAAAERLLGHYQRVLTAICAAPGTLVADVELLSPAERATVVEEWNRTTEDFPHDRTVHALVEAQADRQPDAVAVVCGDESLSYAQLDARANRLAQALRAHGCGRRDRVGVCLERGVDLVVAQLAVAKSGAGYVPLEPSYPAERLRWMLADSGARVVLSREPVGGNDVTVLDPVTAAAGRPATRLPAGAWQADLLYLIYTSGSTGRPKGVLVDHRGRVNNFADFNRRFGVGPGDRVFGVSALAFDMSAYDVFGTLMAGATVVFPPPADERSPDRWIEVVERERVTVWHSVPALFGLLVEEAETRGGPRLPIRLVLLGGDWIPLTLPARGSRVLAEQARLVGMGGATEVSMDSTIHVIERVDPAWRSVPYGAPMANQTAYVLDASLAPLPVGVPGELYLGGTGVGWGYHGRARLTAEKFVPDPFGRPGTRLYRTGDRACWSPGGELELLGRVDFQVKVNGYRVETGEVEAALRDLLGGGSVLVAAHGARDGEKKLVAYLVGAGGPADDELKQALATRLPAHMVPAAFVRLDAFPLTHNGKIDRRALPSPAGEIRAGREARTSLEHRLVRLWRDALECEDVPVDVNFFALGGNSIAVIRMAGAARREGLAITPRMVFAHQTVEALASAVSTLAPAETPATTVRDGSRADIAVTPMQRHMLTVLDEAWVPGLYAMQSTLRLPFEVDPSAFATAWRRLTARHPALRTAFGKNEGRWTRMVAEHVEPRLEVLDWHDRDDTAAGEALIDLLETARAEPPDVTAPPLWRVWLVRSADSWWFGQVQSYLLADGWSNLVLLDELLALYLAALSGTDPGLPPAPALRLPESDVDGDEAYWRLLLSGAAPTRLAARPGTFGPSRFRRVSTTLDAAVGERLRARATEYGQTFSTVVCAAWALLAAGRLDRADVTIGVVSAGRDQAAGDVERAVGLFITALPVRVRIEPGAPLTALLDRFQLARVEGAEHAGVDTGTLQRLGEGGGPLFDSVVVVANYPVSAALRAQQSTGDGGNPDPDGTRNQTEFALRLDVTDDPAPRVALSYYADRIRDEDAARLLDRYLAVLADVAAADGRSAAPTEGTLR
ncbi:hypothetical protein GCM10022222_59550 [Amycolatopsis ultiminotia]|uniref:Carrier domain-containing protein n=1 Tax=Amycolatopsis ultiminotia TaxID=543629 RepID=A0ABP6XJ31_9PSEU